MLRTLILAIHLVAAQEPATDSGAGGPAGTSAIPDREAQRRREVAERDRYFATSASFERIAVYGLAGLGLPIGTGLMVEYAANSNVSVGLGGGVSDTGPQLATMARLRGALAYFGLGASYGYYRWQSFDIGDGHDTVEGHPLRANAEVGVDPQLGHLRLRGFLGLSGVLTPGRLTCINGCSSSEGLFTLYVGAGVGLVL